MSDETQNVQEENAEHTPTPHKSTVFKLLYALLIAIPIISLILLVIIHISSPHCSSEITADGMIEFVVGGLSCISTIALAAVTVWHTEILQRENDSAQQRLEDMAKDANDISRELVQMNERANELAKNANELNMITKIVDLHLSRYHRLETLFSQYSDLFDSSKFRGLFEIYLRSGTPGDFENEEIQKNINYKNLVNEINRIGLEITMIIGLDSRNTDEGKYLLRLITSIKLDLLPKEMPDRTDYNRLLSEIDERKLPFGIYTVKYLSDYSRDINSAMYKPLTLAQVRNLFNPENEENTENGQDENGIPESDSGKHR